MYNQISRYHQSHERYVRFFSLFIGADVTNMNTLNPL